MLWLRAAAQIEREGKRKGDSTRNCATLCRFGRVLWSLRHNFIWFAVNIKAICGIISYCNQCFVCLLISPPVAKPKIRFDQLIFKYNDDACSACKFDTVLSLRSSIVDLQASMGSYRSLVLLRFFCHSPFGKMTFIYLRLVSVKIALVFLAPFPCVSLLLCTLWFVDDEAHLSWGT